MKTKTKVEVFVPAGACGCTFGRWMDSVWQVLLKYREEIDYITTTSDSPRAQEFGISQGIIVNGQKVDVSNLEKVIQTCLSK